MGVLMSKLKRGLAHPSTVGLDIDDPTTTRLRRQIILDKPFLKKIYDQWYGSIAQALPRGPQLVLELGSGAGYMGDMIPRVITSDLLVCPGLGLVADGCRLPFADRSLRGVAMVDVLHHIPQPRRFLAEAARCVHEGGAIAMIEPWVTWWSRWVYTKLHHEPFLPDANHWEFATTGPLSGANGALPWILFHRDRDQFEREFPQWGIETIQPTMPLRYLLSGGVSMRSLQPGWSYRFWGLIEHTLDRMGIGAAMFALIVLRRRPCHESTNPSCL